MASVSSLFVRARKGSPIGLMNGAHARPVTTIDRDGAAAWAARAITGITKTGRGIEKLQAGLANRDWYRRWRQCRPAHRDRVSRAAAPADAGFQGRRAPTTPGDRRRAR